MLLRGVRLTAEAYNRMDLDAVVIAFHPELEYLPADEVVDLGLSDRCYHGHSGYRTYVSATNEVWGTDTRFEPTELIDLGDRLVVLAQAPMRAQASGVPLTLEFAYVMTVKDGLAIRQQEFHSHTGPSRPWACGRSRR